MASFKQQSLELRKRKRYLIWLSSIQIGLKSPGLITEITFFGFVYLPPDFHFLDILLSKLINKHIVQIALKNVLSSNKFTS